MTNPAIANLPNRMIECDDNGLRIVFGLIASLDISARGQDITNMG